MHAIRPEPLEYAIRATARNIADAVAQIEGGQYPQFDRNARWDIGEELIRLVRARREQLRLDRAWPTPKVAIPGLRARHLPGDLTNDELRQIRRFVAFSR